MTRAIERGQIRPIEIGKHPEIELIEEEPHVRYTNGNEQVAERFLTVHLARLFLVENQNYP